MNGLQTGNVSRATRGGTMTADHTTVVQLLRQLERALLERGKQEKGVLAGRIAHRVAESPDAGVALEELAEVDGYEGFVSRLLWLACREGIVRPPETSPELVEFQVTELEPLLPGPPPPSPPPAVTRSQGDLVRRFGLAVEGLKHASSPEGQFRGVDFTALAHVESGILLLRDAASQEGTKDVVDFAEACAGFCRFVREQGLGHDIRTIHVLDNAYLTLQTVLDAGSADDYDSLRQTIRILQNPDGVFA